MTLTPIAAMDELEFAKFFQTARSKILEDPLKNFVKAPGFVNFQPTPGQSIVLKSSFGQRLDPDVPQKVYVETTNEAGEFDLEYQDFTETELFRFFTGMEYEYTGKKYNRINLICGRRSGKSTVASILALYSAIKVNWKPFLSKTPVATVAVLSHSVEFSQEIIDILKSMTLASPVLSRLIDPSRKNTHSTYHLKVPFLIEGGKIEYSLVAIKVGAASKKTTRGRAVCTLLADEACHWALNDDAAESDLEIFRAVRPALMQFGEYATLIKLSSPAIKQGVMYEEYLRREELKDDFVQLKAPSWMMNSILPKEEFLKEHALDPDGFDCEFRASFKDSISNFILPEFVDLCVTRGVTFQTPATDGKTIYAAAIDAAFKGDRFAFSLVGYNEARVTQYAVKWWEGSKKKPVAIHEVASYIRTICRQYGLNEVTSDQYSFQPMRELFLQYGINLVENTFTLPYKRKIYFGLKRLIHNQQIDLLDVALQQKEIKELVVEQTASGQIRIGHPTGGSDDCVPPDTLIKCQRGYKKITDIRVGDLVYTHKGRLRKVLKVFEKDYDTELYNIKPFCQPSLQLTGNHPLYVNSAFYGTSKRPQNLSKFSWKKPLEWKGSYRATGLADFELANRALYVETKTGIIPPIDVTTKDFGLLLGYFLGDGWAIRPEKCVGNSKYKISLAFNSKDKHLLHHFTKVLAKYGVSSHQSKENHGCVQLLFHSKLLWSIFSDCYDADRSKVLPQICYTHPVNYLGLIGGWLLADGWKTKVYQKPHGGPGSEVHRVGCTTSKKLALELKDICWKIGLEPSFSERTSHRYGKACKDQYWLAFRNCRSATFIKRVGDFLSSKAKVTSTRYIGRLYNLHVEEDESYVANGLIVHNCSDALAVATHRVMEKAGVVQVTYGEIAMTNDYGVATDAQGRAFKAPPVELLHAYQGFQGVIDNSHEWIRDPATGKWQHISEMEGEEISGDSGNFVF